MKKISVSERNFVLTCGFLKPFFVNFFFGLEVLLWYCVIFKVALIVVCRLLVINKNFIPF